MKRDDVAQVKAALAALGPLALVERLGLHDGAKREGSAIKIRCPWHAERTPSCSVGVRDSAILAYCHGCARGGDALGLVAVARGLDERRDFRRVLAAAAEVAGADLDERAPARPAPALRRPPVPAPSWPPAEAVAELWAACGSVYNDPELAEALRRRALDPADLVDRDLARALPVSAELPPWARYWRPSNRLIVALYDATGRMVTLRARRLDGGDGPKALPARGFRVTGAVMADPLGRLLLAGEAVAWWTERTVIVSEGEPDFLTVATHYSDASEQAPAVIGIVAGAWTAEIAARLPAGCRVVIRTHSDAAGDRYAEEIGSSLAGRCELFRREAA